MAKLSAKGAVITLTDPTTPRTISGDVASYEIIEDNGMVEVTGFNEGGANSLPGMPKHGITLDLYYNAAANTGVWTVLRAIKTAGTACTMTIKPEASGLTYTFICFPDTIPLSTSPADALKIGSVHFSQMGATAGSWA